MIEDKTKQRIITNQQVQEQTQLLDDPQKWAQLSGSEIFVLRKETLGMANQQLNKKLSKQYQLSKIDFRKKTAMLRDPRERITYDYESYPEKKEMYALRELFAKQSRSNELMKANHDLIKKQVEKISKMTQAEDSLHLKDGDIARYTLKNTTEAGYSTRPPQQRPDPRANSSGTNPYFIYPNQR